ncbi:MAG: hypothetical protein IIY39_00960, partial [Firmicutes bacterium]|nr:hypothetical protein [Bacillota bacterium]
PLHTLIAGRTDIIVEKMLLIFIYEISNIFCGLTRPEMDQNQLLGSFALKTLPSIVEKVLLKG